MVIGAKVARSYGSVNHKATQNDFLQSDWVEITQATMGKNHLLMVRDTRLLWQYLSCFVDTFSNCSMIAFINRHTALGEPRNIFPIGLSHFLSETLRLICKG